MIAAAGGNINIVDNNHHLPLWYAVSHNRPAAVKALLRANSRTDPARDSENNPEGGVPLRTALVKVSSFFSSPVLMHGGLLIASYASLSVCLTVRLSLDQNYQKKIHILRTVLLKATKFNMVMNVDNIWVMCEGQGHRSKVDVTRSKNVIFKDFTKCI